MTRRADAVTVLSLYLVLLTAIPSQLTFAPLGGAGSPARILGLGCLGWWAYEHIRRAGRTARQPVRAAFFALLFLVLVSYVVATTREMSATESNAALTGVVLMCSFGGSLLLASDGAQSYQRLLTIYRRVVFAGACMAALACFQFATGESLVDKISVPGLSVNTPIAGVLSRDGMNRPSATASHPIELGMVLTMVLPLALNLALVDSSRTRLRRCVPAILILFATFLVLSRSAMIGLVIGLAVVAVRWPPVARRALLVVAPLFGLVLFMTVPGLLGTIGGLFTGAGQDSSVHSRTDSYAIAAEFIGRSPLVGRGFGTFLPQYRILDNQYLGLFIEIGLLGLLAFLALMITGMACAGRYRRRAPDAVHAQLAQGLKGAIAVGAGCLAFFDGISFPIGSGLLFLLIGIAGAGARLTSTERSKISVERTAATPPYASDVSPAFTPVPLPIEPLVRAVARRWYVTLAGLALTGFAAIQVAHIPGVYWTQSEVVFLTPQSTRYPNSISTTSTGAIATAGLVAIDVGREVGKPSTASAGNSLAGMGLRNAESIRVPDTGGQWAHDFERPVVDVEVVGTDKAHVEERSQQLIADVRNDLRRRQAATHTPQSNWITSSLSPERAQLFYLIGQPTRGAAVVLLLGGWATLILVSVADVVLSRRKRIHSSKSPEEGRRHALLA